MISNKIISDSWMRGRLRKDPSMVGKLSNKQLNLSFCLQSEQHDRNVSAILPCIQSKGQLGNKQSKKLIKTDRKPSIIHSFEEDSEKPLPQIRVSFSKLYQLRKVCLKNPEEPAYINMPKQREPYQDAKPADLVGHLYSPRSRSVMNPANSKNQQLTVPGTRAPSPFSHSRSHFSQHKNDLVQPFRDNKKVKVRIVDYNRKFHESQDFSAAFKDQQTQVCLDFVETSLYLKEQSTQSRVEPMELSLAVKTLDYFKEHSTQSRVVPIASSVPEKLKQGLEVENQSQEMEQLNGKSYLKDNGYQGYMQVEIQQGREEKDDLAFIWEQNYLEHKENQPVNHAFFLEEYHQQQEINKISLGTSLSELKIMLIELNKTNKVSFDFPSLLLNTITPSITQPEVHVYAETVFSLFSDQTKPQLISFKKYQNCILVTTKTNNLKKAPGKLALLWYYSGRVYVGGWTEEQSSNGLRGFKQGLGLYFYPSNFIYYGTFDRNARRGYGVMKKASRQVYVGQWSGNKRSGWGKVFDYGGNLVFDGDFEGGRFTQKRMAVVK